jgi:hypothetical protein
MAGEILPNKNRLFFINQSIKMLGSINLNMAYFITLMADLSVPCHCINLHRSIFVLVDAAAHAEHNILT